MQSPTDRWRSTVSAVSADERKPTQIGGDVGHICPNVIQCYQHSHKYRRLTIFAYSHYTAPFKLRLNLRYPRKVPTHFPINLIYIPYNLIYVLQIIASYLQ